MITDCHLHIIDRSALDYPWLGGVPALDRDFLYETYTREARRCGISKVLHMEVDVAASEMELETAYVEGVSRRLTALREPSLIRGCIAACRPEGRDFPALFERALANPFVKGLRRVLHVVPDEVSEGVLFRENLKRLSGTRLTFDLCTLPHQVDKVLALADLNPDITFILDHCGVPAIATEAHEGWSRGIAEVAKRPNVLVKLSGIVAYADAESWKVETLRPYVATVIEAFGPFRMLWGSDWPVVTLGGTLSVWVAATHALLADLTADERRAIFSGNAARLWSI